MDDKNYSNMSLIEEYGEEFGILPMIAVWAIRNYVSYVPGLHRQFLSRRYAQALKPWVEKDMELELEGTEELYTFTRACTDLLGLPICNVEPLRRLLIGIRRSPEDRKNLIGVFYNECSHLPEHMEPSPFWSVGINAFIERFTEQEEFNWDPHPAGKEPDFVGKYRFPRRTKPITKRCPKTGQILPGN